MKKTMAWKYQTIFLVHFTVVVPKSILFWWLSAAWDVEMTLELNYKIVRFLWLYVTMTLSYTTSTTIVTSILSFLANGIFQLLNLWHCHRYLLHSTLFIFPATHLSNSSYYKSFYPLPQWPNLDKFEEANRGIQVGGRSIDIFGGTESGLRICQIFPSISFHLLPTISLIITSTKLWKYCYPITNTKTQKSKQHNGNLTHRAIYTWGLT